MTVTGTITWIEQGPGLWALVADDGQTYELYGTAAADLNTEGQKIVVEGKVREDVMSMAMVGPILEVVSYRSA